MDDLVSDIKDSGLVGLTGDEVTTSPLATPFGSTIDNDAGSSSVVLVVVVAVVVVVVVVVAVTLESLSRGTASNESELRPTGRNAEPDDSVGRQMAAAGAGDCTFSSLAPDELSDKSSELPLPESRLSGCFSRVIELPRMLFVLPLCLRWKTGSGHRSLSLLSSMKAAVFADCSVTDDDTATIVNGGREKANAFSCCNSEHNNDSFDPLTVDDDDDGATFGGRIIFDTSLVVLAVSSAVSYAIAGLFICGRISIAAARGRSLPASSIPSSKDRCKPRSHRRS